MDIGAIIFYDNKTGEVLVNTGEYKDAKAMKSVSDYINTYELLKNRNRDTFDYVSLMYGEFKEEFSKMTSYKINVADKKIIFSYKTTDGEIIESDKPLVDKIKELSDANASLEERLELTEGALIDLADALLGGEMV